MAKTGLLDDSCPDDLRDWYRKRPASIYLTADAPRRLTAKYLVTLERRFNFNVNVPADTPRAARLRELVDRRRCSENPITLLYCFDQIDSLVRPIRSATLHACICGGLNGGSSPSKWEDYMRVFSEVFGDIEQEYGNMHMYGFRSNNDVNYVDIAIGGPKHAKEQEEFVLQWNDDIRAESAGKLDTDLRYFLNVGQHRGYESMMENVFKDGLDALGFDDSSDDTKICCSGDEELRNKVESITRRRPLRFPPAGTTYDDSSLRCSTVVFEDGNGRAFINNGYIDRGAAALKNTGYLYHAEERIINSSLCIRVNNKIYKSIPEFELELSIKTGETPRTGDMIAVSAGNGYEYVVFDGKAWVHYDR